ncbi:dapper homolog 3 isoform X2 [Sphaerodactylus townsendi]|uniref:dapper homolog 3 isoform X2 n=1 Tax=Sphaerodactylus townsendi TaxID=933632 RepID=UPI002026095E|nr:dapper homolog 3 isoform X2 [Sphaerodactylus townsendi]
MMRPFSFPASPERSRLRGWLEGTVAGLCELQLLRERQERRVRWALRLAAQSPAEHGEPEAEEQLDLKPIPSWHF